MRPRISLIRLKDWSKRPPPILARPLALRRDAGGRGPTQANILIELAQSAELFHTPDGIGFADLDINGHRETWPIRAKGFRRWLARRFFEATQGAPSSEAGRFYQTALFGLIWTVD